MSIALRRIAEPAAEESLAQFEQACALRLPDDYRQFLRTLNGGLPENNTEGVRAFFCLGAHPQWSLEQWAERCRGRLPAGLLPVAADGRGSFYCLSHAGAVWFWDHEQEPGPGEIDQAPAVTRLADTFTAFVASLEPFDPDDLPAVHEEDWAIWTGDLPDGAGPPRQPPPTKVRVQRRPRHWSENLRPPR